MALALARQDLAPVVLDGGVVAVGGDHLGTWLRESEPVLGAPAVRALHEALRFGLGGSAGRAQLTTADLGS